MSDDATPQQSNRQIPVLLALGFIIAASVLICYLPALRAPVVFDSKYLLTDRAYRQVQPLWLAAIDSSRSLVVWTFAMTYPRGQFDPARWRATNVAIHIVAALTLFALVRGTLALDRVPKSLRDHATAIGFATALLWAVHPLQTQSVTYLIQRHESLMAAFFLLTMYLVLRGWQSARWHWLWYLSAIVTCRLGMSCKTVMVMAPLVILLYDYAFLATDVKQLFRRRWWLYGALAVTAFFGVYQVRSFFNPATAHTVGVGLQTVSPWEYFRTQPQILLHYIRLALWPDTLCIDYRWPVEDSPWRIYGPGLVVVGLVGLSLWTLWRRPMLGFLGMSFFLILAPTSTIVPIVDLAFEHRMYLPLAPLMVLVVLAVHGLARKLSDARARLALQVGLLVFASVGLVLRTMVRNADYVDPVRLWTKALAVNPDNARPYNHLGRIYHRRGDTEQAIAMHTRALELREGSFAAHVSLSQLYLDKGEISLAIAHCRRAMEILPNEAVPYYNLGVCYQSLAKPKLAEEYYRQAIQRDRFHASAHNNLALLLQSQGKFGEAIDHFQLAIEANPRFNVAIVNLGELHRKRGNWAHAIAAYRRALQVDPNYAPTHAFLGLALAKRGETIDAIGALRRAVKLAPAWPEAKLHLAWTLATTPQAALRNGPEAVTLAEAAIEQMDGTSARALDTLAAALAANGRYDAAVAALKRALRMAEESGDQKAIPPMQHRLTLYRQQMPFIERP